MDKCKDCKGKVYKYQTRGEYEVFSPLFYFESYDNYKKKMLCKKCNYILKLNTTQQQLK